MNRQQRWKKMGATDEQIKNHLSFKAYQSKLTRERKKRNNEKNKEIIKQIKADLLNKKFGEKTITKINPSVDGRGFWWHCHKKFYDGSEGDFRYFSWFDDYSLENFKEESLYL